MGQHSWTANKEGQYDCSQAEDSQLWCPCCCAIRFSLHEFLTWLFFHWILFSLEHTDVQIWYLHPWILQECATYIQELDETTDFLLVSKCRITSSHFLSRQSGNHERRIWISSTQTSMHTCTHMHLINVFEIFSQQVILLCNFLTNDLGYYDALTITLKCLKISSWIFCQLEGDIVSVLGRINFILWSFPGTNLKLPSWFCTDQLPIFVSWIRKLVFQTILQLLSNLLLKARYSLKEYILYHELPA